MSLEPAAGAPPTPGDGNPSHLPSYLRATAASRGKRGEKVVLKPSPYAVRGSGSGSGSLPRIRAPSETGSDASASQRRAATPRAASSRGPSPAAGRGPGGRSGAGGSAPAGSPTPPKRSKRGNDAPVDGTDGGDEVVSPDALAGLADANDQDVSPATGKRARRAGAEGDTGALVRLADLDVHDDWHFATPDVSDPPLASGVHPLSPLATAGDSPLPGSEPSGALSVSPDSSPSGPMANTAQPAESPVAGAQDGAKGDDGAPLATATSAPASVGRPPISPSHRRPHPLLSTSSTGGFGSLQVPDDVLLHELTQDTNHEHLPSIPSLEVPGAEIGSPSGAEGAGAAEGAGRSVAGTPRTPMEDAVGTPVRGSPGKRASPAEQPSPVTTPDALPAVSTEREVLDAAGDVASALAAASASASMADGGGSPPAPGFLTTAGGPPESRAVPVAAPRRRSGAGIRTESASGSLTLPEARRRELLGKARSLRMGFWTTGSQGSPPGSLRLSALGGGSQGASPVDGGDGPRGATSGSVGRSPRDGAWGRSMAHSDSGSASASVSDHWAALESMPSRVGRASLSSAGASRPPASRSPWSFLRDVRRVVQRESADPASPEEWRELLTTAYTEACGVDEERRALWDEVHELRESKRAVEEQLRAAKAAPLPGPSETAGRWTQARATMKQRSSGERLSEATKLAVRAQAEVEQMERRVKVAEMELEESRQRAAAAEAEAERLQRELGAAEQHIADLDGEIRDREEMLVVTEQEALAYRRRIQALEAAAGGQGGGGRPENIPDAPSDGAAAPVVTQPSVGSAPALATPADSRRVSFVESKDDEDIPGSPRSYLLQRGVDTKVLKPFKLTIEKLEDELSVVRGERDDAVEREKAKEVQNHELQGRLAQLEAHLDAVKGRESQQAEATASEALQWMAERASTQEALATARAEAAELQRRCGDLESRLRAAEAATAVAASAGAAGVGAAGAVESALRQELAVARSQAEVAMAEVAAARSQTEASAAEVAAARSEAESKAAEAVAARSQAEAAVAELAAAKDQAQASAAEVAMARSQAEAAVAEASSLRARLSSLESSHRAVAGDALGASERVLRAEEELGQSRARVEELSARVHEVEAAERGVREELAEARAKAQDLSRRVEAAAAVEATLRQELSHTTAELATTRAKAADAEQALAGARAEAEALQSAAAEAAGSQAGASRAAVAAARAERDAAHARAAEAHAESRRSGAEAEKLRETVRNLEGEAQRASAEVARWKGRAEEVESHLREAEAAVGELQRDVRQLRDDLAAAERRREAAEAAAAAARERAGVAEAEARAAEEGAEEARREAVAAREEADAASAACDRASRQLLGEQLLAKSAHAAQATAERAAAAARSENVMLQACVRDLESRLQAETAKVDALETRAVEAEAQSRRVGTNSGSTSEVAEKLERRIGELEVRGAEAAGARRLAEARCADLETRLAEAAAASRALEDSACERDAEAQAVRRAKAAVEASLDAALRDAARVEDRLQKSEAALREASGRAESAEAALRAAQEGQREAEARVAAGERRVEEADERAREALATASFARDELEAAVAERDALAADLAKWIRTAETATTAAAASGAEAEKAAAEAAAAVHEAERLGEALAAAREEVGRARATANEATARAGLAEQRSAELETALTEAAAEVARLQEGAADAEARAAAARDALAAAQAHARAMEGRAEAAGAAGEELPGLRALASRREAEAGAARREAEQAREHAAGACELLAAALDAGSEALSLASALHPRLPVAAAAKARELRRRLDALRRGAAPHMAEFGPGEGDGGDALLTTGTASSSALGASLGSLRGTSTFGSQGGLSASWGTRGGASVLAPDILEMHGALRRVQDENYALAALALAAGATADARSQGDASVAQPSVPAHIDLALQAAQHEVAVLYQRLEDVDHRAAMLHSHLRQAQAESRAAKQRLAQSEVEKIAILCDSEEAAWAVLADHDRRTTGNGQGRSPTIGAGSIRAPLVASTVENCPSDAGKDPDCGREGADAELESARAIDAGRLADAEGHMAAGLPDGDALARRGEEGPVAASEWRAALREIDRLRRVNMGLRLDLKRAQEAHAAGSALADAALWEPEVYLEGAGPRGEARAAGGAEGGEAGRGAVRASGDVAVEGAGAEVETVNGQSVAFDARSMRHSGGASAATDGGRRRLVQGSVHASAVSRTDADDGDRDHQSALSDADVAREDAGDEAEGPALQSTGSFLSSVLSLSFLSALRTPRKGSDSGQAAPSGSRQPPAATGAGPAATAGAGRALAEAPGRSRATVEASTSRHVLATPLRGLGSDNRGVMVVLRARVEHLERSLRDAIEENVTMQAMRDRALAEVDALRGDVGRARAAAEAAGLPRALTQPPASSRPPGSLDTNVAAGRTAADVAASARAFDAERELVALTGAYEDLQARYARVGADLSEERARSRELAGGLQTAESRAREAAESLASTLEFARRRKECADQWQAAAEEANAALDESQRQCARLQQLARELESRNAALEVELRRAEAHAVAIGHELDDALAQRLQDSFTADARNSDGARPNGDAAGHGTTSHAWEAKYSQLLSRFNEALARNAVMERRVQDLETRQAPSNGVGPGAGSRVMDTNPLFFDESLTSNAMHTPARPAAPQNTPAGGGVAWAVTPASATPTLGPLVPGSATSARRRRATDVAPGDAWVVEQVEMVMDERDGLMRALAQTRSHLREVEAERDELRARVGRMSRTLVPSATQGPGPEVVERLAQSQAALAVAAADLLRTQRRLEEERERRVRAELECDRLAAELERARRRGARGGGGGGGGDDGGGGDGGGGGGGGGSRPWGLGGQERAGVAPGSGGGGLTTGAARDVGSRDRTSGHRAEGSGAVATAPPTVQSTAGAGSVRGGSAGRQAGAVPSTAGAGPGEGSSAPVASSIPDPPLSRQPARVSPMPSDHESDPSAFNSAAPAPDRAPQRATPPVAAASPPTAPVTPAGAGAAPSAAPRVGQAAPSRGASASDDVESANEDSSEEEEEEEEDPEAMRSVVAQVRRVVEEGVRTPRYSGAESGAEAEGGVAQDFQDSVRVMPGQAGRLVLGGEMGGADMSMTHVVTPAGGLAGDAALGSTVLGSPAQGPGSGDEEAVVDTRAVSPPAWEVGQSDDSGPNDDAGQHGREGREGREGRRSRGALGRGAVSPVAVRAFGGDQGTPPTLSRTLTLEVQGVGPEQGPSEPAASGRGASAAAGVDAGHGAPAGGAPAGGASAGGGSVGAGPARAEGARGPRTALAAELMRQGPRISRLSMSGVDDGGLLLGTVASEMEVLHMSLHGRLQNAEDQDRASVDWARESTAPTGAPTPHGQSQSWTVAQSPIAVSETASEGSVQEAFPDPGAGHGSVAAGIASGAAVHIDPSTSRTAGVAGPHAVPRSPTLPDMVVAGRLSADGHRPSDAAGDLANAVHSLRLGDSDGEVPRSAGSPQSARSASPTPSHGSGVGEAAAGPADARVAASTAVGQRVQETTTDTQRVSTREQAAGAGAGSGAGVPGAPAVWTAAGLTLGAWASVAGAGGLPGDGPGSQPAGGHSPTSSQARGAAGAGAYTGSPVRESPAARVSHSHSLSEGRQGLSGVSKGPHHRATTSAGSAAPGEFPWPPQDAVGAGAGAGAGAGGDDGGGDGAGAVGDDAGDGRRPSGADLRDAVQRARRLLPVPSLDAPSFKDRMYGSGGEARHHRNASNADHLIMEHIMLPPVSASQSPNVSRQSTPVALRTKALSMSADTARALGIEVTGSFVASRVPDAATTLAATGRAAAAGVGENGAAVGLHGDSEADYDVDGDPGISQRPSERRWDPRQVSARSIHSAASDDGPLSGSPVPDAGAPSGWRWRGLLGLFAVEEGREHPRPSSGPSADGGGAGALEMASDGSGEVALAPELGQGSPGSGKLAPAVGLDPVHRMEDDPVSVPALASSPSHSRGGASGASHGAAAASAGSAEVVPQSSESRPPPQAPQSPGQQQRVAPPRHPDRARSLERSDSSRSRRSRGTKRTAAGHPARDVALGRAPSLGRAAFAANLSQMGAAVPAIEWGHDATDYEADDGMTSPAEVQASILGSAAPSMASGPDDAGVAGPRASIPGSETQGGQSAAGGATWAARRRGHRRSRSRTLSDPDAVREAAAAAVGPWSGVGEPIEEEVSPPRLARQS